MALVTMVPTSVLTFLSSQAVLSHYGRGYSLSDPTALRVTLGTGIYLTLVGLLGSALGWVIRRTAGAISALSRTPPIMSACWRSASRLDSFCSPASAWRCRCA